MAAAATRASSGPVGRSGRRAALRAPGPSRSAPRASASASRAPGTSSSALGQHVHLAPVGDESSWAGPGRRRTTRARRRRRGRGAGSPGAGRLDHLGEVAEPLDGRAGPRPARGRRGRSRTGAAPRSPRRPGWRPRSPRSRSAAPPSEQGGGLARLQRPWRRRLDVVVRCPPAGAAGRGRAGSPASLPGHVGRDDERGHPDGGPGPRGDGVGGVAGELGHGRRGRGTRPTPGGPGSRCPLRGAGRACRWEVAWSPTTFTIGVRARRALCRLAIPLPRPGPRCSRVAAGRPAMRP